MLIDIHEKSLGGLTDLHDFLCDLGRAFPAPLAIMGGHFMLMYSTQVPGRAEPGLVSMIGPADKGRNGGDESTRSRDNAERPAVVKDPVVAERTQIFAGAYPQRSFRLAAKCVRVLGPERAKIAMLVNDHKLKDASFHPHAREEIGKRAGELRQDFYRRMGTKLPLALEAILREFGFTPDEAIVRNHARRQKQDLLPDDSIYFSEQALRSRFDNATKELVKGIDGFDYVPNQDGTYLMYYRSHHGPAPECLTEYGTCGSFGVVMQFLIRLRELGYRSCFLLSPHECTSAMHAAALASTEGYELPLWLCVATGIGGEGEEFDETWAPEPSTVTFCPRDR